MGSITKPVYERMVQPHAKEFLLSTEICPCTMSCKLPFLLQNVSYYKRVRLEQCIMERMFNEAFRAVVERRLTRMRWWSVAVLGMVILSNMNCNDVFLLPSKIKPLLTVIQQRTKKF